MESPNPSNFENFVNNEDVEESMKIQCELIMKKHLMGKEYDKKTAHQTGEIIIQDIYNTLSKLYPFLKFGIFFYFSEKSSFVSNNNCVINKTTDNLFLVSYHTNNFYSHVIIYSAKEKPSFPNFFEVINDNDMISHINNIMNSSLEGKNFDYDECQDLIGDICVKVNEFLLAKNIFPFSVHLGYINKLPIKGCIFTYKFFGIDYTPFIFNYSGSDLTCKLYLFIVNF